MRYLNGSRSCRGNVSSGHWGVNCLGSNGGGVHLRGIVHIGCPVVVRRNQLVIDIVDLVTLTHLSVLNSPQFVHLLQLGVHLGLLSFVVVREGLWLVIVQLFLRIASGERDF